MDQKEEYFGNNALAIAKEWLLLNPVWVIALETIGAGLATLLTGVADLYVVFHVVGNLFTDALGRFSATWLGIMAVSVGTLLAYTAMEILHEKHYRTAMAIVYASIVVFLAAVIARSDTMFFEGVGSGFVLTITYLLAVVGQAVFFTIPGLLFILASIRLRWCFARWRTRSFLLAYIDLVRAWMDESDAVQTLNTQASFFAEQDNREKILDQIATKHREDCVKAAQEEIERLTKVTENTATSHGNQIRAKNNLHKLNKFVRDHVENVTNGNNHLNPVLLLFTGWLMFSGSAVAEETTAQILAKAQTCALLVDVSDSSPVWNDRFMAATSPIVLAKIEDLPLASQIVIATVGNPGVDPYIWRGRILAKRTQVGAPKKEIVKKVKEVLYAIPKEVNRKDHTSSHLITGLHDGAATLNYRSQANCLGLISDFREVSSLANCERQKCRIPDPTFKLPQGTSVYGWGFGAGISDDRAKEALWRNWKRFLEMAGAHEISLTRF